MKAEDIKNLYSVTPQQHRSIERTLQQLEYKSIDHYHKRQRFFRFAVAIASISLLALFSTVAYATRLFGMITEDVGEYGKNISIIEETLDSAEIIHNVKPNPTYLPKGCCQLIDDEGGRNPEGVTTYNENGNYKYSESNDMWVLFHVYEADNFFEDAHYIIDSFEKKYNGHKVVFMTRQIEDNGKKDYYAVEYFEDWGYVVDCYYGDMTELMKIMAGLELQEADETINQMPLDISNEPTSDYAISMESEKREYRLGETFTWSRQKVTPYEIKDREYSITVKSVNEHDGVKGLNRNNLLVPDDDEWYSRYFNTDGSLKTPYIRTDYNIGDGINSLGHIGSKETKRRFFLVTIEVQSIDNSNECFNGQFMTDIYGAVIYQDNKYENGIETIIVGVIADEEELSDLAIAVPSIETVVDDEKKTVVQKDIQSVIYLPVNQ